MVEGEWRRWGWAVSLVARRRRGEVARGEGLGEQIEGEKVRGKTERRGGRRTEGGPGRGLVVFGSSV